MAPPTVTPNNVQDDDEYDETGLQLQEVSVEDPDPEQPGPQKQAAADDDADDQEPVHDQLPSVEEYKADMAIASRSDAMSSSSRTKAKVCARLVSLAGLLIAFITIAVVVFDNDIKNDGASADSFFPNPPTSPTSPTDPPGPRPEVDLDRLNTMIEFLVQRNVSTATRLQDSSTSQYQAAEFLVNSAAFLKQNNGTDRATAKRWIERYVLALLYYEWNGPEWSYQSGFLTEQDHCQWNQHVPADDGKSPTTIKGVYCHAYDYDDYDENQVFQGGLVQKLNLGTSVIVRC